MLADREHVQTELVGELSLLHQLAHTLERACPAGEVCECSESEFHVDSVARNGCARNYRRQRLRGPHGLGSDQPRTRPGRSGRAWAPTFSSARVRTLISLSVMCAAKCSSIPFRW